MTCWASVFCFVLWGCLLHCCMFLFRVQSYHKTLSKACLSAIVSVKTPEISVPLMPLCSHSVERLLPFWACCWLFEVSGLKATATISNHSLWASSSLSVSCVWRVIECFRRLWQCSYRCREFLGRSRSALHPYPTHASFWNLVSQDSANDRYLTHSYTF